MKALIAAVSLLLALAFQVSAQFVPGDYVESPTIKYIEFSAATCQDTAASTGFNLTATGVPTATCVTGTNINDGTLSFADAEESFVEGSFWLPKDWTGAIDYELYWKGSLASTNTVDWTIETICVADGETMDPSFNTRQEDTNEDAGKGTANQINFYERTGITTTGCAADELFFFRIGRDGDDATNDTYLAAAEVIVFRFLIRRGE